MTDPNQQTFNEELRGAVFPNDKGGNPARPDYRGRCMIDGKHYRISGWARTAKASGQRYMSLAFTADTAADLAADQTAAAAATVAPAPAPTSTDPLLF